MGCVYRITFPNDKKYIGQTIGSLKKRLRQHDKNADRGVKYIVYSAIRKYGWENLKFECVFETDDKEFLNLIESELIAKEQTKVPFGYNSTDGGDGTKNLSPLVRKAVGQHNKARYDKDPSLRFEAASLFSSYWNGETRLSRIGEKHKMSRLSNEEVLQIKDLLFFGPYSVCRIAKFYNVSSSTIKRIKDGSVWSHLTKISSEDFSKRAYKKQSDEKAIRVLELTKEGASSKEISKMLDLSIVVIWKIRTNKSYKHIDRNIYNA